MIRESHSKIAENAKNTGDYFFVKNCRNWSKSVKKAKYSKNNV